MNESISQSINQSLYLQSTLNATVTKRRPQQNIFSNQRNSKRVR